MEVGEGGGEEVDGGDVGEGGAGGVELPEKGWSYIRQINCIARSL